MIAQTSGTEHMRWEYPRYQWQSTAAGRNQPEIALRIYYTVEKYDYLEACSTKPHPDPEW